MFVIWAVRITFEFTFMEAKIFHIFFGVVDPALIFIIEELEYPSIQGIGIV